jgi:hypothetical protein
MGAGPGRRFATLRATGWFQPTHGHELEGDLLAYRVVLPLTLTVRVESPLVIHCDITTPSEDEVVITVATAQRRAAVLQKMTGLDGELRRFLMRVVEIELDKPHVRRATRIDMGQLIDKAWPALADQFLPINR